MRGLINIHLTGLNQDPIQDDQQLRIVPNNLMDAQGIPNPGELSVYVVCRRNSECYKLTLQRSLQRIKVYLMEPQFMNTKEDRVQYKFTSKKNNGKSISVAKFSMLVYTGRTTPEQYLTRDGVWVDETVDHKDGNPMNNSLDNLRWSNGRQQVRNTARRRQKAIEDIQNDLDNVGGVLFTSHILNLCRGEDGTYLNTFLDSCSCYTIAPGRLLRNIQQAPKPIKFATRTGSGYLTHFGEFNPIPGGDTITAWIADNNESPFAGAAILALRDVASKHRVTYDSTENDGAFIVHTNEGKQHLHKCPATGFPRIVEDIQRSNKDRTSPPSPPTPPQRRRRRIEILSVGASIYGNMILSEDKVAFQLKGVTEKSCDSSEERPNKIRCVGVDNQPYKRKSTTQYRSKRQDGSGYKYT